VINELEPFVSAQDIAAGARWQIEVAGQLEASDFGIVCVTASNQHAPWLNFEAGALAKAVGSSRVVPLAVDLKVTDVTLPLAQFQAQPGTMAGLAAVTASLNACCERPLTDERLDRAFERWWEDLQSQLTAIQTQVTPTDDGSSERSERDLLEEILSTVRSQLSAEIPAPSHPAPVDGVIGELVESLPPGAPSLRFSIVDGDGASYFLVRSDDPLTPTNRAALARLASQRGYEVRFVQTPNRVE